ncbi:MAG TPA: M14 family zinc carboxypeptidase, partial [Longimicrobiaceae bacterium]|nr:M14 family zinc carboxypeptidase [Longimicrobiaceae bacterium]
VLTAALLLPCALAAQNGRATVPQTFDWWQGTPIPATTAWGEAVDTTSTRLIRSWTTMPEYTNPLVDWLPASATVVSPTRHFGQPVGQPGVLHRVDEIYGYFEALAASSPRVRFQRLGETEEGNRLALAQVGSERNLARLDEIKRGLARLADPRGTDAAEAQRLIGELPVVYALYAGLHSPETGPPEMVMELAYRLAVSDDPMLRTIRDSVVVFIVPVAEPDGRNRVVDWLRKHGRGTFDEDDRIGPPYWGKYIFHDNNRDGLQLSARLTQELVGLFLEWKYPVGHDLHESVPYLYTSTGTGPYNPSIDAITVSEWQWLANFEVTALTALGMPGVWTHGFYDGWYPGYLLWVTNTRNAVGRFYETFGSSNPNTMKRTVGAQTSVEWYRPNPPRRETMWSLRNNTNYMQTGVLHALYLTAQNRRRVLEQYWTKASNAVRRGRTEKPFAWVVPAGQPRRADAAYMLNLLRRQGIEVHRAAAEAEYGGVRVRRGDYLVRMDQPYRGFVQTLFEVQRFPADAPTPYDDVAWTYPLMFNVEARAVEDSAVRRLAMEPVRDSVAIAGGARGGGAWYLVDPAGSAHSLAARLALRDVRVEALEDSLVAGGRTWPAGTWVIPAGAGAPRVAGWARDFGVEAVGVGEAALRGAARHELDLPRVAVLHSWRNTQDEGWTRYALDRIGLPYTYLAEDRLRAGGLRERFDVILFPSQGSRAAGRTIFGGVDPRFSPLAYVRSDSFPSLGWPDSTSDMTGGMRFEGLAALRDFLEAGGTLVTLG